MLLLIVLLLSGLVSYPGFPLTEVPDEYRALIFQASLLQYRVVVHSVQLTQVANALLTQATNSPSIHGRGWASPF